MFKKLKTNIQIVACVTGLALFSASPIQAQEADHLVRFKHFLKTGQPQRVIETANSKNIQESLLLAQAYLQTGQADLALEIYENAQFHILDNDESISLGLAKAKTALGQLDQARRHLKMAHLSGGYKIEAELILASIDEISGHVGQARQRLEKLYKLAPNHESVVLTFASFNVKQQALNEAARILERFLLSNADSAKTAQMLGNIYQQWGHGDKAATYFKIAHRLYNENGDQNPSTPQVAHKDDAPAPIAQKVKPVAISPLPQVKQARYKSLPKPTPLPFSRQTALKTGSGFIIGQGQYIVTNRHVVDHLNSPNEKIAVRNGLGELKMAHIHKVSQKDDLAILKTDQPFRAEYAIPFHQLPNTTPGSGAIVMGFPLMDLLGQNTPSLTDGIISKATGLGDDQRTFLISSKMNKGNSGGPIFNKRGELIGIAVAKLDVMGVYEERGHLAEDMNLAIKANSVQELVGPPSSQPPAREVINSLEELYQTMLPSVVLVASRSAS
ncbi:putative Trypsin-like serine protease [Candidatus Terasakiella magnetica]|uniref:Putative Trypsin-like serine protease n=1 Tax=Candidatus Terasakiella magnetica TaxID=1867952 RepID=A0A1C3RHY6_9PROT|nr:serine protease [Candidatus Terasakiella magnetica]SCA56865.1 putative Trypsin-like serine protease [Candidatus Terasakiella magnetica]